MNKKLRRNVELLRDILLILSVPVIFSYLYILHQEQLELKESTIQLLQQEKEQLANNQIENVSQRYEALKKFYSEEAIILRDTVESQKVLISEYDSIIKNTHPDSTVNLSIETARQVLLDLEDKDLLEKVVNLYMSRDSLLIEQIERYEQIIIAQQNIIKSYKEKK